MSSSTRRTTRHVRYTRRGASRLVLCLCIGTAWGLVHGATLPAATPHERVEVVTDRGLIQGLDFAAYGMQIGGVRYVVAVDAVVRIRGSASAFTLLRKGMRVEFTYRNHGPGERVVFLIEQLPDNTPLEEV